MVAALIRLVALGGRMDGGLGLARGGIIKTDPAVLALVTRGGRGIPFGRLMLMLEEEACGIIPGISSENANESSERVVQLVSQEKVRRLIIDGRYIH